MKKHHFIKDSILPPEFSGEFSEPLSPPLKESLSHENRFDFNHPKGQKKSKIEKINENHRKQP